MPDIDATFRGGGWCEHISELQQSRTLERQTILLDATQQPLLVDLDSFVVAMDGAEWVCYFARPISDSLEAARTLDAQLALITNSLPIPIARVDRDLRFTYVNKGYERLFGRPRKEFVGHKLEEVLGAGDMANLQPFIKRVFLGETVTFERSLYMTALGKRVLRETFTPDTSEEGQVVGYFMLGLDITAKTDIRDARKLSEARGQSQGQLLDAIESISVGFALFDSEDRLIVSNSKFRSAFPKIERHIRLGAKLPSALPMPSRSSEPTSGLEVRSFKPAWIISDARPAVSNIRRRAAAGIASPIAALRTAARWSFMPISPKARSANCNFLRPRMRRI